MGFDAFRNVALLHADILIDFDYSSLNDMFSFLCNDAIYIYIFRDAFKCREKR